MRVHEHDPLLSNAGGDLLLCVCLSVKLACYLADAGGDELLAWLLHGELIVDLILKPLYCGRVFQSLFRFRYHEICVFDDSIHEERDLHQKVGIADSYSASAGIVCAGPAFFDFSFGADMPYHRSTAVTAPDSIPHQGNAFAFAYDLISLSGRFCRRCFLKRILIDDGVIDLRAGVFGVIDDPCDPRFIPYFRLFRIRHSASCQFLGQIFERGSFDILVEDISDNVSFAVLNDGSSVSHGVSVWNKACLLHGLLLYQLGEFQAAKESDGHFVLLIYFDALDEFVKQLVVELLEGFLYFIEQ